VAQLQWYGGHCTTRYSVPEPTPVETSRRLDHPASKLAPGADRSWIHVSIQDLHGRPTRAAHLQVAAGTTQQRITPEGEGTRGALGRERAWGYTVRGRKEVLHSTNLAMPHLEQGECGDSWTWESSTTARTMTVGSATPPGSFLESPQGPEPRCGCGCCLKETRDPLESTGAGTKAPPPLDPALPSPVAPAPLSPCPSSPPSPLLWSCAEAKAVTVPWFVTCTLRSWRTPGSLQTFPRPYPRGTPKGRGTQPVRRGTPAKTGARWGLVPVHRPPQPPRSQVPHPLGLGHKHPPLPPSPVRKGGPAARLCGAHLRPLGPLLPAGSWGASGVRKRPLRPPPSPQVLPSASAGALATCHGPRRTRAPSDGDRGGARRDRGLRGVLTLRSGTEAGP